jgi:hypothetical protein
MAAPPAPSPAKIPAPSPEKKAAAARGAKAALVKKVEAGHALLESELKALKAQTPPRPKPPTPAKKAAATPPRPSPQYRTVEPATPPSSHYDELAEAAAAELAAAELAPTPAKKAAARAFIDDQGDESPEGLARRMEVMEWGDPPSYIA